MQKLSLVRYISWPQWIEELHIIDKVGVQHQALGQTKACGEIILPQINLASQKFSNITIKADKNPLQTNI